MLLLLQLSNRTDLGNLMVLLSNDCSITSANNILTTSSQTIKLSSLFHCWLLIMSSFIKTLTKTKTFRQTRSQETTNETFYSNFKGHLFNWNVFPDCTKVWLWCPCVWTPPFYLHFLCKLSFLQLRVAQMSCEKKHVKQMVLPS